MSQAIDEDKQVIEPRKLYRLPEQGMIAGVVAGLAAYFTLDVTLLRILLVIALFMTGGGIILPYFIAAILMPVPGKVGVQNLEVGEKIEGLAGEMKANGRADRARNWVGIGLVLFGAWLLLGVVWPQWLTISWDIVWPSVLILAGVLFLIRGRK